MKKILFGILCIGILSSCATAFKTTSTGAYLNTAVLSKANFKNLGNYTGVASLKRTKISIKNREGLLALAKKDLINNARNNGVELKGSRTLANICVEEMRNFRRITISISADIVEFTE
jgi:hypothetical protein